jgi:hypothetical protein
MKQNVPEMSMCVIDSVRLYEEIYPKEIPVVIIMMRSFTEERTT